MYDNEEGEIRCSWEGYCEDSGIDEIETTKASVLTNKRGHNTRV